MSEAKINVCSVLNSYDHMMNASTVYMKIRSGDKGDYFLHKILPFVDEKCRHDTMLLLYCC